MALAEDNEQPGLVLVMSYDVMTAKELRAVLAKYPDDMPVVVPRDRDYWMPEAGCGPEYDAPRTIEVRKMVMTWDVYKEIGPGEDDWPGDCLILSATEIRAN